MVRYFRTATKAASAGKSSQRPPESHGNGIAVDARPMASEDRGQRSFGLLGAPKMPKVGERAHV